MKGGDDPEPYTFCSAATDTGQQLLEEGWHVWQKAVKLYTPVAAFISWSVRVSR